MKLLFIAPKTFYPESSGGAQHSTLYLLKQLQKHHWDIRVICRTSPLSDHSFKNKLRALLPPLTKEDTELGFPCKRCLILPSKVVVGLLIEKYWWRRLVDKELSNFKPDLVLGDFLANDPIFKRAINAGIPCIKFIRSLPVVGVPSIIPAGLYILGNSPYSAAVAQAITGQPHEYILPFVDAVSYKTTRNANGKIVFINPTPQKGVDIALEIAKRMPDDSFLFVMGKWAGLRKKVMINFIKSAQKLPNVKIVENQSDMRKVYADTKILLVPSQFIETFGRVIREAQLNGIPVVASDVGGIPYTVGKGGIIVKPKNDIHGYIMALRSLSEDKEKYKKYSDLALENANRKEFDPEFQFNKFLNYALRITQKELKADHQ